MWSFHTNIFEHKFFPTSQRGSDKQVWMALKRRSILKIFQKWLSDFLLSLCCWTHPSGSSPRRSKQMICEHSFVPARTRSHSLAWGGNAEGSPVRVSCSVSPASPADLSNPWHFPGNVTGMLSASKKNAWVMVWTQISWARLEHLHSGRFLP